MKRIPLSRHGKNKGKYEALVDDEDYDWLMQWRWSVAISDNTQYAQRMVTLPNGKKGAIQMHRAILGLDFGDKRQVDHINHNGLDNRREKLAIVTVQQNNYNISNVKEYSWQKRDIKFEARITVNGRRIYLGLFADEGKARRAYLDAKRSKAK